VATPIVVRTGMPARPRAPLVYVVAFWKKVCTTTSRASVAMAIVDSVMRMIAPPKIAATTNAARADTTTAAGRPKFAFATNDGSSGNCAAFTELRIVTSAVV
jgi:hypothetical protein